MPWNGICFEAFELSKDITILNFTLSKAMRAFNFTAASCQSLVVTSACSYDEVDPCSIVEFFCARRLEPACVSFLSAPSRSPKIKSLTRQVFQAS